MLFSGTTVVLLAAGAVQIANAHTAFTNFFVDGVDQGDGFAVRMSNDIQKATFPISSVDSPDMACGVNGETGVARVSSATAGSTIVFEWRDWPDGSQPGSIDISHKGPCAVYMKKVADASASNNAAGDGWFKIMDEGYDSAAGKWCTEKLIPNDGHLAVTIPNDLATGYYLLRPELLALHQADKTPADPQFYVGCAQIVLTKGGSATPEQTVSIPGYVNMSTPAMTFDIWAVPMALPFPDFGPPVYTAGSSKRGLESRATLVQTIGLVASDCVMQNANWCGFMPPSYTDQNSCYSSSANCSAQTASCYSEAGPTGSKNCHNWEAFCTALRTGCQSGDYNGPPSIAPYKPAPLEALDVSKVVSASGSSAPSTKSSPSDTMTTTANTASASIDTCGSNNGGLTCQTGLCCSSHGYCGTSTDYCGSGCQAQFGTCSPSSRHKRAHLKYGGHVMRKMPLGGA